MDRRVTGHGLISYLLKVSQFPNTSLYIIRWHPEKTTLSTGIVAVTPESETGLDTMGCDVRSVVRRAKYCERQYDRTGREKTIWRLTRLAFSIM